MTRTERFRGCLLGLAAGDALGTTIEFQEPGSFTPLADIVGGGPFRLKAGQWTDDTSMALCLAESLTTKGAFDPDDQMQRYCRWHDQGHMSSTGRCFDIGTTTSAALRHFKQSREPFAGSEDPYAAGNGSIMRLCPVPMFFANDPASAIQHSALSSRTTHAARTCVDACRYFGGLIVGALHGAAKNELLSPRYTPCNDGWAPGPLCPQIQEVADGSFKTKEPPRIVGSGYVVQSLEAALWAFHKSENFEHGCLLAVNLGHDADTTGAVYGQIAGAYYGEVGIPARWLQKLTMRDLIVDMAGKLFDLSGVRDK